MDYTVHGILQVRILAWVAFPFSRGSSQPRDWTQVSCIAGGILYQLSYQGTQQIMFIYQLPRGKWILQPLSGTEAPFMRTWRLFWEKAEWNRGSGPRPGDLSCLPSAAFERSPGASRTPSEVWESWGIWTMAHRWRLWERDNFECDLHEPVKGPIWWSSGERRKSNYNPAILMHSTHSEAASLPPLLRR